MRLYSYPAVFEPGKMKDVLVVTFPDVPEAVTQGKGYREASENARDALGVALLGILTLKRPLPLPSSPMMGQELISVEADLAGKIALLEAWRDAGITQSQFAQMIGKDDREVRRILDPDHSTKLQTLAAALHVLDRRLVVGVEEIKAQPAKPFPRGVTKTRVAAR